MHHQKSSSDSPQIGRPGHQDEKTTLHTYLYFKETQNNVLRLLD